MRQQLGLSPSSPCCSFSGLVAWKEPLGSSVSPLLFHRELYSQFLREMIIQPGIAKANMGVSREDVTFEDHVSKGGSRGWGYKDLAGSAPP